MEIIFYWYSTSAWDEQGGGFAVWIFGVFFFLFVCSFYLRKECLKLENSVGTCAYPHPLGTQHFETFHRY